MTIVTLYSSSLDKALLATQMKVKVYSHENHTSVLHPRTWFRGLNISMFDQALNVVVAGEFGDGD